MARLLLLNGPNLNLLGQREPEVYGSDTLASIEERAKVAANKLGHELIAFQSNRVNRVPQIHLMKLDGTEQQLLVSVPGGAAFPSFSQSGNELCFNTQVRPRTYPPQAGVETAAARYGCPVSPRRLPANRHPLSDHVPAFRLSIHASPPPSSWAPGGGQRLPTPKLFRPVKRLLNAELT